MGRKLARADDPLLVSVRSGAKFSMPGMMETVLNIGLSDPSVSGLAQVAGDERFAWDSYRRLIQMFGKTVLDIDGEHFEEALDAAKRAKGITNDLDLDADDLAQLGRDVQGDRARSRGARVPAGPARADGPGDPRRVRLLEHRPRQALPAPGAHPARPRHGGQHLLDGLRQPRPRLGHRRRVHPRPGHRHSGVYGDYLANAQGEDVVAGIRNTLSLQELEELDKTSYDELMRIMKVLEGHYRDLCDIEFTIERGKLWMLQTRVGKRTAAAAFLIANNLVDQGMIARTRR